MVVIRLSRVGKKNSPAYRVVVADKQKAVKRKYIEAIGHYNPTMNPKEIVINSERAIFWMNNGAKPSPTVNNLMADLGIIKKSDKINKIYGKATKKKTTEENASSTSNVSSEKIKETETSEAKTELEAKEEKNEDAVKEVKTPE